MTATSEVPRATVACLLVSRDRVLLAPMEERPQGRQFLTLPGGELRFGETLEGGIRREIREALGCGVEELRSVGFSENLLRWQEEPRHELAFLFAGRPDDERLAAAEAVEMSYGGGTLPARWLDLVDLSRTGLPVLPNGAFDHIRVLIGARGET